MRVASLHVYPVKSCAGVAVRSWPVDERGLRHDRRFVVVGPDGKFITQRDCAELALIRTAIDGDSLTLTSPSGRAAHVPLSPRAGSTLQVTVWNDAVDALLPSVDADGLLSAALGQECRLAWMPEDASRHTAEKRGEPRRRLSFCDATPVHLVTEAALEALNGRLRASGVPEVGLERFRANIVLAGVPEGADDGWAGVTINGVEMRVTDSCKRCKVVTIDQGTAARVGPEPLQTLKAYRFEEGPVSTGASFGQRLTVERAGTVAIGDAAHPRARAAR